MLLKKDWKETNNQSNWNRNGGNKLKRSKKRLIVSFWQRLVKLINWRVIWEQDLPYITIADHTSSDFDLYSYLNKIEKKDFEFERI